MIEICRFRSRRSLPGAWAQFGSFVYVLEGSVEPQLKGGSTQTHLKDDILADEFPDPTVGPVIRHGYGPGSSPAGHVALRTWQVTKRRQATNASPKHAPRLDWMKLAPDVYKAMIRLDTVAGHGVE